MRVLFDARSVVPRRSGIGNYAEALLQHLVPLAPEVRFLVLRHPSATEPIVPGCERVEELRHPGETKSVRTVLTLALGRAARGADLYHSPADLVPLGLPCPWVVTIHDLMWVESPSLASAFLPVRWANGLWYRTNIRRAVEGAAAVISISQSTADAIGRCYPAAASKVRVVRHGIALDRYDPARTLPRASLDRLVPPGARYSLIVGQGSPYKNHGRMVRAFLEATADTPDHRLVLVRRFSRVDRRMNRLLAEPAVRRRVVLLPFVSEPELLSLYRHARMLLFASLYEGFGLPALEAMALGTPVLGSTAPAVAEVTGPAALHADARSHDDLVRSIRVLDRDEPMRARLVAAGRRRLQQFDWHACAEATLEVYRAALAGRPAAEQL